ncbi:MAG: 4a-hydroxytetrahydrobiopterin dehydratase [Actinomycetota bacterium]
MARPQLLNEEDLAALVADHPEWEHDGDYMRRTFVFADFGEAWAFMSRVALVSEKLDHHPEWSNVWNRVEVAITTHDAGGLSDLDRRFVAALDAMVTE